MTKKIFISQVEKNNKKKVEISGWLFNKRSSGSIHFLQIRDGTGYIQAIAIKSNVSLKAFKELKELNLESSLILTGLVKKEPRSPTGYELEVSKVEIIHNAAVDYPIGKKDHGVDFLLDNRHLWLRSSRQRAIQIIRNELTLAITEFYAKNSYFKIDTPIITPNACEGTTTLFEIDYFGKKSYLSQSGQLYLEAAIFSLRRVYDFAPVFRAEKSKTRRHLVEFWMTNAEAAFVEHKENLDIQEKMIVYIFNKVLKNCKNELEILKRDVKPLEKVKSPFIRMSYERAIKELKKLGSDIKYGKDFGNDDETLLTKAYEKPIFIEYFPANIKAFYMKKHPQDKSLALCADLLAPEGYGEVIGGSEREDNYDRLLKSINKHKLSVKDFSWYLDLRKYGSVPHSGFGLGLERILAWFCGLKHVRETAAFPRLLNRSYP
ncbi:asparagine--tRNA ligase [Patescibacteria group bacterium]